MSSKNLFLILISSIVLFLVNLNITFARYDFDLVLIPNKKIFSFNIKGFPSTIKIRNGTFNIDTREVAEEIRTVVRQRLVGYYVDYLSMSGEYDPAQKIIKGKLTYKCVSEPINPNERKIVHIGRMGNFYTTPIEPDEEVEIILPINECKRWGDEKWEDCGPQDGLVFKTFKVVWLSEQKPEEVQNEEDKTETKDEEKREEVKEKRQIKKLVKNKDEIKTIIEELKLNSDNLNLLDSKMELVLVNLPSSAKEEISSNMTTLETKIKSTPIILNPPEISNQQNEKEIFSKFEEYLFTAWDWTGWLAEKTSDIIEGVGEALERQNIPKVEVPEKIDILSKTQKVTEAFKDLDEVSKAFREIDLKIWLNKMSSEQGKLLKAGYGLGKAVKWLCKKLPVFGDESGEAIDGSFQAALKAGEKIAEHTFKTNKCIENPDECD